MFVLSALIVPVLSQCVEPQTDCTDWESLGGTILANYARDHPTLLPPVPLCATETEWAESIPDYYESTQRPQQTYSDDDARTIQNACNESSAWPGVLVGPLVTQSGLFIADRTYCRVGPSADGSMSFFTKGETRCRVYFVLSFPLSVCYVLLL